MNIASPYLRDEVFRLTLDGASTRAIMLATGLAKATVMGYRNRALAAWPVQCGCGKPIKHQGWCAHRMARSPGRQAMMKSLHTARCVDCGGPAFRFSTRCKKCYIARAQQGAINEARRTRPCKICGDAMLIHRHGKTWKHCGAEWCERLYTFYYVEGRNRPPTVRGGKENGLRFDFFLSDYVKRYADECNSGAKHGRAA